MVDFFDLEVLATAAMERLADTIKNSAIESTEVPGDAAAWGQYLFKPSDQIGTYGTCEAVFTLALLNSNKHIKLIRSGQRWLVHTYYKDKDKLNSDKHVYFPLKIAHYLAAFAQEPLSEAQEVINDFLHNLKANQKESGSWANDPIFTCFIVQSLLSFENQEAIEMAERAKKWIYDFLDNQLTLLDNPETRNDIEVSLSALAVNTLLTYNSSIPEGFLNRIDKTVEFYVEGKYHQKELSCARTFYDEANEPFTLHTSLLILLAIMRRKPQVLLTDDRSLTRIRTILESIKTKGALVYHHNPPGVPPGSAFCHALPETGMLLKQIETLSKKGQLNMILGKIQELEAIHRRMAREASEQETANHNEFLRLNNSMNQLADQIKSYKEQISKYQGEMTQYQKTQNDRLSSIEAEIDKEQQKDKEIISETVNEAFNQAARKFLRNILRLILVVLIAVILVTSMIYEVINGTFTIQVIIGEIAIALIGSLGWAVITYWWKK